MCKPYLTPKCLVQVPKLSIHIVALRVIALCSSKYVIFDFAREIMPILQQRGHPCPQDTFLVFFLVHNKAIGHKRIYLLCISILDELQEQDFYWVSLSNGMLSAHKSEHVPSVSSSGFFLLDGGKKSLETE